MRSKVSLLLYLFVLAIIISEVKAICCGEGKCYPGGMCKDGTWYIGCKSATGQSFYNSDILGECLVCKCASQNSCKWVADTESKYCVRSSDIDTCKVCVVIDNIKNPSSSECKSLKEVCKPEEDSDCDLYKDTTNDECPGTPIGANMDPDAYGCSLDQARAAASSSASAKVPGLEPNVFSLLLAVLALTVLLAYNFERNS